MAENGPNLVLMCSYGENNWKLCLEKFPKIFGIFWPFLVNFHFFTENPWFFKKNLKNSKKHFFDLWDLLWWVFHMVLALNHWFRPKNEGSKKSVPRNYKSAGSNALNSFLLPQISQFFPLILTTKLRARKKEPLTHKDKPTVFYIALDCTELLKILATQC